MKNFLIALLIFTVWSFFGLWMYSLAATPKGKQMVDAVGVSELKQDIPQENETTIKINSEKETPEITTTKKNFVIYSLNNIIIFESDQTIAIEKDNPQVYLPEDHSSLPSLLVEYLENHPAQELHIQSYYSPSASLQTPNIGQQRGIYFKKMLLDMGADQNQIVVKSILSTADNDENNYLINGITFSFKLLNRERIANAKAEIPEFITFYPTYNFDNLLANQKLSDFTDQVVAIYKDNHELQITVIGHTDHIGASSENYVRGLKSARQIQWYLINKGGIERSKVNAISKGESEPLLREGRPASRKENARIEIKFSEEK